LFNGRGRRWLKLSLTDEQKGRISPVTKVPIRLADCQNWCNLSDLYRRPMPPELTTEPVAHWPYQLLHQVGKGTSASVWRAQSRLGPVALKLGHDASERARFAGEATRLILAASPALPSLLGVGWLPNAVRLALALPEGIPYLALEWLPGTAIDPVDLRDTERVEVALIVARDLGQALADLHAAGLAHGDIKPQNVLYDASSSRARPVDLGLSEAVSEWRVQGATPRYLAPECRLSGAGSDAGSRDLWALGITLAEIADVRVATSRDPARQAQSCPFDPRLEPFIRPLLCASGGARPGAEWVQRQAAAVLGDAEPPATRRVRASASLRRAYLNARRPWLERVARGDTLELRVTGLAERWLREAIELMMDVATLGDQGWHSSERHSSERHSSERHSSERHSVEDLSAFEQERLLSKLMGPSDRGPANLTSPSDAELLERLERSIAEQSPRSLAGLVLTRAPGDGLRVDPEDPVELAIALAEGAPSAALLDLGEAYVARHPEAGALGLLVARALRLQEQLGRALGVLDRLGLPEAAAEGAEVARRADDDVDARRRLGAIDLSAASEHVQARVLATWARLELRAGDVGAALARLDAAPDSVATLEARAMIAIRAGDLRAADRALLHARAWARRPEELARLEFLSGRVAHARHQYELALSSFARAADYAVRAGAVLEEATYLSGVAAAASELGQLGQALHAASRSLILFDYLGRPAQAARAALSRASVFLMVGAREEALEAGNEALRLARATGDLRCQAYAHLALAETQLNQPAIALGHLRQASTWARVDATADDLRIAALRLSLEQEVDLAACDARASDSLTSAEVRLIWWGARARQLLGTPTAPRVSEVIRQLAMLVSTHAGVGARGPAFAAGARLAAASGDGELSRRFSRLASEAVATLRRSAPRQLASSLGLQAWTLGIDTPSGMSVAPEQVRDIETLVRALTTRHSLRPLLNQILDALVLWTGVERGLLLLTAPGGRLVPRAARNLARTDLVGAQRELSYSLAERAISTREPVVAVDAVGELPEHHESVHALKLRSLLAIPLFFKGETLGVVYLDDRVRTGAFGPEELAWVRLIGSIASVAIGDARDQLQLRRAARRAKRAESKLAVALAKSEARLDVAERELLQQRGPESTRFRYEQIVGESAAVQRLLRLLDRVTVTDVPVLILGESGTGKELVARALHQNGPRATQAFVSENCSAIPETLLESTLFGHVRGAFTGAARGHAGLFSIAHEGTLFLDEIGEMSLGMQAKLLRVLETGELRPLGSERTEHVDVRVIGATQRDLEAMVQCGTFREDLFYRLNVVSVTVPPLRERRDDILLLMQHFLSKYGSPDVPALSDGAVACLLAYGWPGNVRELENEARRALVMTSELITPDHLSPRVQGKPQPAAGSAALNLRGRVDQLESELVRSALDKTRGNQTRAAELLGLSRFGLQKMIKRLHIGKPHG
jgi:transcriptional regulator with GAF, ATPase, and Fis domain/serine/threonine protein kinase/tetratricopeptide (TPR) repeat protein